MKVERLNGLRIARQLNLLTFLAFLTLKLFISGCGYRLMGAEFEFPPNAKTIAIPTFQNHTFQPALESIMTRDVREELLRSTHLQLTHTAGQADLLLKGSILNFDLIPISFDRERSVVIEYRVKIDIDAQLEDQASGKVLWQEMFLSSSAEYLVSDDTSRTRVAQDRAIAEASKHLAEELVHRLLEGSSH